MLQSFLKEHHIDQPLRKGLETLQVNLGNICNMNCRHCHVDAGPSGQFTMAEDTAAEIISFLSKNRVSRLDLTGGAPEIAPVFRSLALRAKDLVDEIIVRCNLTVLFEEGQEDLPDFYKSINAHLVCSLPCYLEENVDAQRGKGTFKKSIEALQLLNAKGYGRSDDLRLDLVYNPGGAFLPGKQEKLEEDYKARLLSGYGVTFNKLITITNMPIKRFGHQIGENGKDSYMELLQQNFNPSTLRDVMCRDMVSVGWDGRIYDCDFNQVLGLAICDEGENAIFIKDLVPDSLKGMNIYTGDHCFGCFAGEGSSCSGSLV